MIRAYNSGEYRELAPLKRYIDWKSGALSLEEWRKTTRAQFWQMIEAAGDIMGETYNGTTEHDRVLDQIASYAEDELTRVMMMLHG